MAIRSTGIEIQKVSIVVNAHMHSVDIPKEHITHHYAIDHDRGILYVHVGMETVYLVYVYKTDWLKSQVDRWVSVHYPNSEDKRTSMKLMSVEHVYYQIYNVMPSDVLDLVLPHEHIVSYLDRANLVINIVDPWAYPYLLNYHLTNDRSKGNVSSLNYEHIVGSVNYSLRSSGLSAKKIELTFCNPTPECDGSPPLEIECGPLPTLHSLSGLLVSCFRVAEKL